MDESDLSERLSPGAADCYPTHHVLAPRHSTGWVTPTERGPSFSTEPCSITPGFVIKAPESRLKRNVTFRQSGAQRVQGVKRFLSSLQGRHVGSGGYLLYEREYLFSRNRPYGKTGADSFPHNGKHFRRFFNTWFVCAHPNVCTWVAHVHETPRERKM